MLSRFKKIFHEQQFKPTFLGLFINPFYFLRRGLYLGIRENKEYIKGIVLDFGCGCKPYKDIFDFEKYIGIDIEKSGHDHANEDIDVFYNGRNIPFENEYFDSIFSSEVLEHVVNIDEILDEFYRVLRKGAYALVSIPFIWDEHEIPYDFYRYTSFGIKAIFERHKLKIVQIKKSNNYVETIFQMICAYIYHSILPKNKYWNLILTFLLISPFNISGRILSFILPKRKGFYSNNIVLARKEA